MSSLIIIIDLKKYFHYQPDEDISGDHLLAEARVSLVKIFPQMQKQFQVFTDGEDGSPQLCISYIGCCIWKGMICVDFMTFI